MREYGPPLKYVVRAEGAMKLVGDVLSEEGGEGGSVGGDVFDEDEEAFAETAAGGGVDGLWEVVMHIEIEFDDDSGAAGVFRSAAAGNVEFEPVFAFAFAPASSAVDVPVAVGEYAGVGHYQFAFHSDRTFTLSVFTTGDDGDVSIRTYAGAKAINPDDEPSFLRKYGMMIFMLFFMVGRPFISKLIGPAAAAPAPADAAPAASE